MAQEADEMSVASRGSHSVAPLKKTLHCRCPACGFCPTIKKPYGRWVSMHDRQPKRLEMVVAWSPLLQDAGLAWIDNGDAWEWAWQSAYPSAGKRRGGTPSHWMEFSEVPHPPNHDAAPAARAYLPEADHAACRSRESDAGTGSTT
jgi:hypothetical protein